MRISDWSSDVCSSDLGDGRSAPEAPPLVDHPVAVESVEPAAIVDRHALVGKVEHRRLQREMLINGEVDADIEGRAGFALARAHCAIAATRIILPAGGVSQSVGDDLVCCGPVKTSIVHMFGGWEE